MNGELLLRSGNASRSPRRRVLVLARKLESLPTLLTSEVTIPIVAGGDKIRIIIAELSQLIIRKVS